MIQKENTAENVVQFNTPDPFDPASLRLDQSIFDAPAVKKQLVAIPIRKPHDQEFFRVRPEPLLAPAAILKVKDGGDIYLVVPDVVQQLTDIKITVASLHLVKTRQGTLLIWPVTLPSVDGRKNEWHTSAIEAVKSASNNWIKIQANQSSGMYDVYIAQTVIPEPTWPELSTPELLRLGFKDRMIDSVDHKLIKELSGQI